MINKLDTVEEWTGISCVTKASLTSHRSACTSWLQKKNRLIGKGHLSYTCVFLTEYQGHTDPAMKTGMHIFSVCTQNSYKRIHVSIVDYERLVQVHSPCLCCKISPFICSVCTCRMKHSSVPCIHINPLWGPLASQSLLFDVQVLTLLLGKYTLFAHANLCYPTTRL